MLQDIINLIKNNKLLFLAGAGISMDAPANLPSAKHIMDMMIDYGALEEYKATLKTIHGIRYEYVVQVFRDEYDKELQFLNYFMQPFIPNTNHYALAWQILKGNVVITTNFDFLVEQALLNLRNKEGLTGKPLKAIITEKDFLEYSETVLQDQYIVFKLHGAPINYFTGQKTVDSVITTLDRISTNKDKEQDILSLPLFKQRVIQQLDDGRVLVVLGYGGGDTFDIIPEIESMGELAGLVWIDHAQQAREQKDWVVTDYGKNEEIIGTVEELLTKISKSKHIPVYKVQGHTGLIVQHLFQTTFIPDTQPVGDTLAFSHWLQQAMEPAVEKNQCYFSERILRNYQNYTESLQILERMKLLSEKQMNRFMKSYTLNNMGKVYRNTGQPQKALKLFEQAYTIDKELGDQHGMASLLSNMGTIYGDIGQPQKALELYEQAYTIAKEIGDQQSMSVDLSNMGEIYRNTGQPQKALELYEQAYTIVKKLGIQRDMAAGLNNMGDIYQNIGKPQKALELFEQAYAIEKELGNQQGMAKRLNNMGKIYHDTGQNEKA